MKKVLALFSIVVSSLAFSAQLQWSAWGTDENIGTLAGGTAYLLQASETVSTDSIVEVLTNRMGVEGLVLAGFTQWNSSEISQSGGYTYVPNVDAETTASTGEHWWIVMVSEDGNTFAVSNAEYNNALTPDGNISYLANTELAGDFWVTGTVGGDDTPIDPDVPEPTALALLALGVAGVALRRRVV